MLNAMNVFVATLFGSILPEWFATDVMLYIVSIMITAMVIKFVITFVRK